jgi:hypothetical protein
LNASSSSSQTFHAADEAKHEHGRSVVFGDNNEITMTADGLDIGNLRQLRNKSGNLMTGLSYDRDLKTQAVFDFQPHMTTGGHGFGLLRIAYNPYKNNNLNSFSIGQTGKGKCVIIPDENREVCVNNDTHIINSSGGRHNFHNIGHSDHDLSGKFVNAAAVLQIDSSVRTNELSVTISDVANNRAHPVFVSLSLTTSDGTPLDINMNGNEKFGMTLAAPRYPTDGTGELKISLNQFKSNQNPYDNPSAKIEGGLYHAQYTGQYKNNYNAAKEMFRESRTALMNALGINPNAADAQTLLDTAIDGLRIDTAKINAAPSSISFQSISYGSSSAPTQTAGNLVILDEDGNPRIDPRDPDDYASAENNLTVGDTINATYEAAAYAVISHGSDGEGSYLVDGTVNQIDNVDETVANAEHPFEIANHATADIDVTIYDVRKIKSNVPSQNFDDIVMWDSQITLYKALRNGTCTSSQAL